MRLATVRYFKTGQRLREVRPRMLTSQTSSRLRISKIVDPHGNDSESYLGKEVKIQGWVRSLRSQKALSFIQINDGSSLTDLQAVATANLPSYETVTSLKLVGECPPEEYPLQKKRHSLEYLRSLAHLRPRTNTGGAVARVRSALAQATHKYFAKEGFLFVQPPVITGSDCEGAGELFRVTTLPIEQPSALAKATFLTVSGQLAAETHACALGDVYTFGPTFRAENSHTTRHLAEFQMVEPEMAFTDLAGAMASAEAFVRSVISDVRHSCANDLSFFQKHYDSSLLNRLEMLCHTEAFARISYTEAVKLLQQAIAAHPNSWQYPNLQATVAAFDLLVPGVGELVGGSQREERLQILEAKLNEASLDASEYWWYLDLRRYGSVPHSGYGLGFERLVLYVTGMENIRDVSAFPRHKGGAEF
eukprot:GSChrysophyteH1.ASY1.ANO1.71.1 assembled CDS